MSESAVEIFKRLEARRPVVAATSAKERVAKLRKLVGTIERRTGDITKALHDDFGKAPAETELTEIQPLLAEFRHIAVELENWMGTHPTSTPWYLGNAQSEIRYDPKGVVLIIAPWNYPFQLALAPLLSAIAAGNVAVVKPSEKTPATSKVIHDVIIEAGLGDDVIVTHGGVEITQELLKQPFDHVFFTGSTRVGRLVMEAAAKHLASVTLELGGKSPAVVLDDADLEATAQSIAWGKGINAGQTCIAPDYVLVPTSMQDSLVAALKRAFEKFYGSQPIASPDYCQLVDRGAFDRQKTLLKDAQAAGAVVAFGAETNEGERRMAPTVLTNVPASAAVMQEEIFGPLLPVIAYNDFTEARTLLAKHDKPLALYVFGRKKSAIRQLLDVTRSGGVSVNATILHIASSQLPFGGVGPSGLGSYHGEFGFKAFSHERGVFTQSRLDMSKMIRPPYSKGSRVIRLLNRLLSRGI